jgi:hypothetical protein
MTGGLDRFKLKKGTVVGRNAHMDGYYALAEAMGLLGDSGFPDPLKAIKLFADAAESADGIKVLPLKFREKFTSLGRFALQNPDYVPPKNYQLTIVDMIHLARLREFFLVILRPDTRRGKYVVTDCYLPDDEVPPTIVCYDDGYSSIIAREEEEEDFTVELMSICASLVSGGHSFLYPPPEQDEVDSDEYSYESEGVVDSVQRQPLVTSRGYFLDSMDFSDENMNERFRNIGPAMALSLSEEKAIWEPIRGDHGRVMLVGSQITSSSAIPLQQSLQELGEFVGMDAYRKMAAMTNREDVSLVDVFVTAIQPGGNPRAEEQFYHTDEVGLNILFCISGNLRIEVLKDKVKTLIFLNPTEYVAFPDETMHCGVNTRCQRLHIRVAPRRRGSARNWSQRPETKVVKDETLCNTIDDIRVRQLSGHIYIYFI